MAKYWIKERFSAPTEPVIFDDDLTAEAAQSAAEAEAPFWQTISPDQLDDLELAEINELNKLEGELTISETKIKLFLGGGLLALIALIGMLSWSFAPYWQNSIPDYSFLNQAEELADNQVFQKWQAAVVSIEGANGNGSGFNIAANGLIITNRHVVEGNTAINISFPDGTIFKESNWQYIGDYDLAICSLNSQDLAYAQLASSSDLDDQQYIFIGSPLGFDWVISEASLIEYDEHTLVFEGPVRAGSSGSPLFNGEGEVIGVVYGHLSNDPNTGLAVPITVLLDYLTEQPL